MRVSPWSRFARPEGLVRRRYVMAPNSVELAARKDIDLTGPGQVLPEEVPRTILVGRRSDETGPPGPGPRVSRASPRGGFVRRADRNQQAWRVVLATHGYEPTREAAMAAFAKSWRRE